MLRSMYSGVAGLKTHQTKMDVIGNNIANVNTTSYKSQSISFSDLMYQTTQSASGATETRGGVNARQIGLGAQSAAISTAIDTQGATQTTNNPFDLMISGDSFFVVNNGAQNLYTRDGSFYVDGAGNLATQSDGYYVMGWMATTDPDTGVTQVNQNGGLTNMQIMSDSSTTYPPEGTSQAVITGNIDAKDVNITSSAGKTLSMEFYDNLGYLYTAQFTVKDVDGESNLYSMTLTDILDSKGKSVGNEQLAMVHLGNDNQAGITSQVPGVLNSKYYVSSYSTGSGTANFAITDSNLATKENDAYTGIPVEGTLEDLDDAGIINTLYGITLGSDGFKGSDKYTMDELGNLTISQVNVASSTIPKSVATSAGYVVGISGKTAAIQYTTAAGEISILEKSQISALSSENLTAMKKAFIDFPENFSSEATYSLAANGQTVTVYDSTSTYHSVNKEDANAYAVSVNDDVATISSGKPVTTTIRKTGYLSSLSDDVLKYYGIDPDSILDQYGGAATFSISTENTSTSSGSSNMGEMTITFKNATKSGTLGRSEIYDLTADVAGGNVTFQYPDSAGPILTVPQEGSLAGLNDNMYKLLSYFGMTGDESFIKADSEYKISDSGNTLTIINNEYDALDPADNISKLGSVTFVVDTESGTAEYRNVGADSTVVSGVKLSGTISELGADFLAAFGNPDLSEYGPGASYTIDPTTGDLQIATKIGPVEYPQAGGAELGVVNYENLSSQVSGGEVKITYSVGGTDYSNTFPQTGKLRDLTASQLAFFGLTPDTTDLTSDYAVSSDGKTISIYAENADSNVVKKAIAMSDVSASFDPSNSANVIFTDNSEVTVIAQIPTTGAGGDLSMSALAAFGVDTALPEDVTYLITEAGLTVTSYDGKTYNVKETSPDGITYSVDGSTGIISKITTETTTTTGKVDDLSDLVKKAFKITSSDFDEDDTYEMSIGSDGVKMTITNTEATTTVKEFKRNSMMLNYDPSTGAFTGSSFRKSNGTFTDPTTEKIVLNFNPDMEDGLNPWTDISIDLTTTKNYNSSGTSTLKASKGDLENNNTGRMMGIMTGLTISTNGEIHATYSNGQTLLLGQIAAAKFSNASGLQKEGNNLYSSTLNSGDPTVQDITVDGGSISTGVLEMSNVDLSNEFTNMITAQRGFQANSRIITVSDTLLEELTNLKR